MGAIKRASETLVATDTNVLMHLADGVEQVIDAVQTIQKRIPGCRLIATATIIQELAFKADFGEEAEKSLAKKALSQSIREFKIEPWNLIPAGHGITEIIGQKLRDEGLLPDEEKNDAMLLAEAALLHCSILLTSDSHLRSIPHDRLTMILNQSDVRTPLIATPAEIVQKFFR